MKHIDRLFQALLAVAMLTACVDEGDDYYYTYYYSSPDVYDYNDASANSITVRTDNSEGDAIAMSNEADAYNGIERPTGGNVTFSQLRPNTTYYFYYVTYDNFGGRLTSPSASGTTSDYSSTVTTIEPTQVVFRQGAEEVERLLVATDIGMSNAQAVEQHDGGEIWYLQPGHTYYWATEATDYQGLTYRSPAKRFTTRDYNMYVESVSKNSAIFNAGDVYFTKLLLSNRADMSNILATGTSRARTSITGLQPQTTYYVQTEATDLFGTVYHSPVYSFTTRAYSIITQQPEVTSATARLKATIDGNPGQDTWPTVYFEVRKNGIFEFRQIGIMDASNTNNFYCDIAVLDNGADYTVKAIVYVDGSLYTEGNQIAFRLDSHRPAQAVDMGLSVRWASWNVGARSPEEYGGLYYYGDTSGSVYAPSKWVDQYNISGTYRDIARQAWGGTWRMPTFDELKELDDNSTVTQTTVNGVAGYRITSKINGNSIFIPAAGTRANNEYVATNRGYWAEVYSGTASNYNLDFKDEWGSYHYGDYRVWYYYFSGSIMMFALEANNYQTGRSIRPVCP